MPALVFGRSGLAQTAVVWLPTLAAAALLGLVLAYWTWGWFGPRVEPRISPASSQTNSAASASAMFGNAQRKQDTAAPTGIAIQLLGVASASGDRRGYAVVQLDGKQVLAVQEGEDIAPGTRLAEVHPNHVILDRGGVRETLAWPKKRATAQPAAGIVNKRSGR